MKTQLASTIEANAHSATWLEENSQDLYDTLRQYIKDESRFDEVVDAILTLIPNITQREDLRRWGRLLEQVYERTEFALRNGLDGEPINGKTSVFVIQKRPKIPQLPTKTVRRKRLLVHPTQLFEIYLILFMAYSYPQSHEIDRRTILSILRFARHVNDAYCLNKAHQSIAYIYNAQRKFELALNHAHIAYTYYFGQNDNLEAGISAYALGVSYQQLGELTNAQDWYTRSADHYAKTNYRRQYAAISMSTMLLKYSREEWDLVVEWADITIRESHQIGSKSHVAVALHTRGLAYSRLERFEEAFEDLEEAVAIFKSQDDQSNVIDTSYAIALVHAMRGNFKEARNRITTLRKLVEKHISEEFKAEKNNLFDHLIAAMQPDGDFGALFSR